MVDQIISETAENNTCEYDTDKWKVSWLEWKVKLARIQLISRMEGNQAQV